MKFSKQTSWIITSVLLIIIFVLFVLYSSRNIIAGDSMFLYDQSREILLVKLMITTHKATLIGTQSGIAGLFHGPLWLYILVPFFVFGHGNPIYLAYAYVTLMLATILVGFIVGKKLYNFQIGLLIAFLIATNSYIWQRVATMDGLYALPLVYLFITYFLIRFVRGDKWAFIFVCFFAGLNMQFESSSSLVLLVLLPVLLVLNYWYRMQFILHKNIKLHYSNILKLLKRNVFFFLYCIFAILLSLSTFILFDLRHNFLTLKSLFFYFFHNANPTDNKYSFVSRIIQHTQSFITIYQSIFFVESMLLQLTGLLLVIFGFWYVFIKKKNDNQYKVEILICLLFPLLMYIVFLFYSAPVYIEYISGLLAPVTIGFSLLLYKIWENKIGKVLVIIFFIETFSFIGINIFNAYSSPYIDNPTAGSLLNQESVVNWVYQDAKGKPFSYFIYSPDTYTYNIDYLMWWKGISTYHYQSLQAKSENTYLIMYKPLTNDRNAHNFWIKNEIHTNAPVIETKIFTGDITVEKLHITQKEQPVDPNYYQGLIFR